MKQQGISIIEIMVSLALGSILALGVIQIFAGSQASNDIIMGEARLTENSRFAVDTVATTLRMTGHRSTPEDLPSLIFGATNPAVTASDGDDEALDTASPRSVEVTMGGADTTLDAVTANADTITVQYQGLDDDSVLNCLGQTVAAEIVSVDTFFVAEGATAAATSTEAAEARASRLALYCSATLIDASGVAAAPTTLAIANDVMNLQIELGDDSDGDGAADRFVSPSTAGLNMEDVVSVRMTITMYGARPLSLLDRLDADADTVVERELRRQFVRTISLRNLLS